MSRSRRKNVGIYVFLAMILLFTVYLYCQSKNQIIEKDVTADYQKSDMQIEKNSLTVYIADNAEKQRLGLSIFQELPENVGMLFVYGNPQKPAFWMKGMKFDIDIVWIRNNEIVGVTSDISHYNQDTRYYPEVDIDTVLELNAGYCKSNGIEVGDKVG